MTITIKEIAKKANVSIATVSRALNNLNNVKPATRDLIFSISKELNYKPNIMARNLAKNTSNIIGIVLPEIDGEYFSELVYGIDEIAFSGGFHTIVASSHANRTAIQSEVNFMNETLVGGMVILTSTINKQIYEIINNLSIPTIIINSTSNIKNIDSIGIDNYQGAYSMTEFLIKSKEYKKIAHIKGPLKNTDSLLRFKGYLAALKDNNIRVNEKWIIDGEFTAESGEYACRKLLSLSKRPEVIFAGNDMMALGCYRAIQAFGLKIPTDIGVCGFDNIFLAEFLNPRLTTINVQISEIGRKAARMLLERMKYDGKLKYKHLNISTDLVIGNSC